MPEKGFNSGTSYLNMPQPEQAQQQAFSGMKLYKGDISDYSSLAYTLLMKQQEQAFTEAMYNYNNWYNSDAQRMKRRLAAGLNPYGLDGSAPAAAAPAPSAPGQPRSAGLSVKRQQQTLGSINQLIELAGMANEMYELMSFKGPSMLSQVEANRARAQLSGIQGERYSVLTPLEAERLGLFNKRFGDLTPLIKSNETAKNDWLLYYIYGPGMGPNSPAVETGPRAQEQKLSLDLMTERINQLKELVRSVYPSEVERNKALTALDAYRQQIMEGQNDAILNISTGNDVADAWIRFLSYNLRDAAQNMVPSFGFSKRFY